MSPAATRGNHHRPAVAHIGPDRQRETGLPLSCSAPIALPVLLEDVADRVLDRQHRPGHFVHGAEADDLAGQPDLAAPRIAGQVGGEALARFLQFETGRDRLAVGFQIAAIGHPAGLELDTVERERTLAHPAMAFDGARDAGPGDGEAGAAIILLEQVKQRKPVERALVPAAVGAGNELALVPAGHVVERDALASCIGERDGHFHFGGRAGGQQPQWGEEGKANHRT